MLHVFYHLSVHIRQLPKVKVFLVDELTQLRVLHPKSEGLQAKLFLFDECVMLVEEPRNEKGLAFLMSCVISNNLVREAGPHLPSSIGTKLRLGFARGDAFPSAWLRYRLFIAIVTEWSKV